MQTLPDSVRQLACWAAAACYGSHVFIANSLGDTVSPIVAICGDIRSSWRSHLQPSWTATDGSLAVNNVVLCTAAEQVRLSHFCSCSFLVWHRTSARTWTLSSRFPGCGSICVSACKGRNCCPCLLWPNGRMDQNATWCIRPRPHCARWGPSSPKKGHIPNLRPMSVVAKRLDGSRYHLVRR